MHCLMFMLKIQYMPMLLCKAIFTFEEQAAMKDCFIWLTYENPYLKLGMYYIVDKMWFSTIIYIIWEGCQHVIIVNNIFLNGVFTIQLPFIFTCHLLRYHNRCTR